MDDATHRDSDESLSERLAEADRQIRRDQLCERIRALGGILGGADGDKVSDVEVSFLEHVLAWETGPRSTNRAWLARRGKDFMPPAELVGPRLKAELWQLIHALVEARVFLYCTNHLSDAELYARLWSDVLAGECPDVARGPDDACHWDFADAGSGHEEVWLRYYASAAERARWVKDFPETILPAHCRAPYRRDYRLPVRD